jgi:hypothetical protein
LLGGTAAEQSRFPGRGLKVLPTTEWPHIEIPGFQELFPPPALHSFPPPESKQIHGPVHDLQE